MLKKSFIIIAILTTALFASDKTRIAIQNISAKAGVDPNAAATVTDLLSSELVSLRRFDVVDRKNMESIMKEQALQQGGCTDQACAVKLGNLLNVQKMVVGSLSKLGSKYLITVSFVDVEKSQVELSDKITADSEEGLFSAVQTLAKNITSKVGILGRIVEIKADGKVLINLGKDDNVQPGQAVAITRPGKAIVDPSTGDFLGREVTELGSGKIESFIGNQLSVLKLDGAVKISTLKQGDRVGIEAVNTGSTPIVTDNRNRNTSPATTPASSGGGNPAKPILGVTGAVLLLGGAGATIGSFVLGNQADNKFATYSNLGAGTTSNAFVTAYSDYKSAVDTANLLRVVGFSAAGLGLGLIIVALIIPDNKTSMLFPTYDGDRIALQYYRRF
ncbi:MAG: hypothetical protein JNM63_15615 [Spirochaetia bacterium]|nr:hypothetical protein [Spirochaetia bacterium]